MKVYSSINYPATIRQNKPKYGLESFYNFSENKCESADKESVNRGYNGGSFTSREKAAAGFWFRMLDKIIDGCNDHTVIVQNLVALGLAAGPRPLAIISLPGKKSWVDKVMAACQGIASGVVGFLFASFVMYPLGEAAKRIYNPRKKTGDAVLIQERFKNIEAQVLDAVLQKLGISKEEYLKNPDIIKGKQEEFKAFQEESLKKLQISAESLLEGTKVVGKKFLKWFGEFDGDKLVKINGKLNIDKVIKALNMAPDVFFFGILKAMLTIALIPPLMKHVFGMSNDKHPQKDDGATKVSGGAK